MSHETPKSTAPGSVAVQVAVSSVTVAPSAQTGQSPQPARLDQSVQRDPTAPFRGRRVHLVGVGGSGMRGAAILLRRLGAEVTGSDRSSPESTADLARDGVVVSAGHDAAHLPRNADFVVHSAAVASDNPELCAARALDIPVMKYAELLGMLMDHKSGVAVAGTHGKSTTTALCAHVFRVAGLAPSFILGAIAPQLGGSSGVDSGPHFIVEACEFDRSFLNLKPTTAAILNIERDHLDCYRDLGDIKDAFHRFAANVAESGVVVTNHEDASALAAVQDIRARVETFGFHQGADWRAVDLRHRGAGYEFDVICRGQRRFRAALAIAGRHNVANALAAVALTAAQGVDDEAIARGLACFEGVDRRMTVRGQPGGVILVDDYAHHPTEIRVTLEALRQRFSPRRLWVVFQPHQHSRTRLLLDDFARSFSDADEVLIPDVYRSRDSEDEIQRTDSGTLAACISAHHDSVRHVAELRSVVELLADAVRPGDLVVTMGAGDVWQVSDELVKRL